MEVVWIRVLIIDCMAWSSWNLDIKSRNIQDCLCLNILNQCNTCRITRVGIVCGYPVDAVPTTSCPLLISDWVGICSRFGRYSSDFGSAPSTSRLLCSSNSCSWFGFCTWFDYWHSSHSFWCDNWAYIAFVVVATLVSGISLKVAGLVAAKGTWCW